MSNGGEFDLPSEVLSVLPSDPYEQLDVARRITAMAVAARVSKLESETGKLRHKLTEKEHMIYGLQEHVAEAESTLQETSARLSHALDEQVAHLLFERVSERVISGEFEWMAAFFFCIFVAVWGGFLWLSEFRSWRARRERGGWGLKLSSFLSFLLRQCGGNTYPVILLCSHLIACSAECKMIQTWTARAADTANFSAFIFSHFMSCISLECNPSLHSECYRVVELMVTCLALSGHQAVE